MHKNIKSKVYLVLTLGFIAMPAWAGSSGFDSTTTELPIAVYGQDAIILDADQDATHTSKMPQTVFTGNVGIQTRSPQATLDVNGTIRTGTILTGNACSIEGAMGYDPNTHNMDFCNGSVWTVMGGSAPSGAVMAFNLSACPSGWIPFAAAKGRTIIGVGTGAGLTTRNLLDSGGEETHQLTINEMPSHQHTESIGSYPIWGSVGGGREGDYGGLTNGNRDLTSPTGGDQPHNVMMPWIALLLCEKS